jgi:type I restriction enzyme R subunit
VTELLDRFAPGQQVAGEQNQREFIALLGAILRLQNILTSFDDFEGNEILTDRQMQDYRSEYLDIYASLRPQRHEKEAINDDIVFEIELIKQVEITVDYILLLVQKYRDERGDGDDKEIRAEITRAIDASPSLRNKKDLIEAFVERVTVAGSVDDEWVAFVAARQDAELTQLIADEGLNADATRDFIDRAFRDGTIQATGVAITRVLPPVSRFAPGGGHGEKKQRVLNRFAEFFERYFGLG